MVTNGVIAETRLCTGNLIDVLGGATAMRDHGSHRMFCLLPFVSVDGVYHRNRMLPLLFGYRQPRTAGRGGNVAVADDFGRTILARNVRIRKIRRMGPSARGLLMSRVGMIC